MMVGMDRDGDGYVTWEEFIAVATDKIEKLYDYIDLEASNGNKVGFEIAAGQTSNEIKYELVTPPTP